MLMEFLLSAALLLVPVFVYGWRALARLDRLHVTFERAERLMSTRILRLERSLTLIDSSLAAREAALEERERAIDARLSAFFAREPLSVGQRRIKY